MDHLDQILTGKISELNTKLSSLPEISQIQDKMSEKMTVLKNNISELSGSASKMVGQKFPGGKGLKRTLSKASRNASWKSNEDIVGSKSDLRHLQLIEEEVWTFFGFLSRILRSFQGHFKVIMMTTLFWVD